MTEPTEEEVKVVAKALSEVASRLMIARLSAEDALDLARAAILALDEHRAAEAPKHKDDF
jgi:hypothetical protein